MNKPYISKHSTVDGFAVWIVDGDWIRKNTDIEFTNYAHPLDKKYVPADELWIDREHEPSEAKFYIAHMLTEHRMLTKGYSHDRAHGAGAKEESRMRSRDKLPKELYKALLDDYSSDTVQVWVVNGHLVRDKYDVEFTEGGHDKRYKYIPEGEVWIDDDLEPHNRGYVVKHELHERQLMSSGVPYEQAHKEASRRELYWRQNNAHMSVRKPHKHKKLRRREPITPVAKTVRGRIRDITYG